ncbi:ribosome maturation factor RimM [Chitiniphilus shinanonensis]|uniref:Ribosome maturation factor RimM n=1 Tax=Chitiniphilus shinanonensis TaxID=553088 RepID=A0ABQ6BPD8_9NEIS|nr:ribosome maturation factor RimM [Chitiniphilus shinanonensis]GLS03696.1 ribosome maturation factor RimM [Chitiniphilus shinanonensis]
MGYVSGAFGIRGWVNVVADTEFVDSLFDYDTWWIGQPGQWRAYALDEGQVQPKKLGAKLVGVDDRELAVALKGSLIAVPRSAMPEPAEGEYYWADLIGHAVVNTRGEALGVVAKLFETGANDVLVVQDGAKQRLLPFVKQVVLKVDMAAKSIEVDWGLDY